jgi:hypothetical protein
MSRLSWLRTLHHTPGISDLPSHSPGTVKGEEWALKHGREPGRDDPAVVRTARDSTSLNAAARDPIDARMPHIPPS